MTGFEILTSYWSLTLVTKQEVSRYQKQKEKAEAAHLQQHTHIETVN